MRNMEKNKGIKQTEIDRIKDENWLPQDFFLAEVICDYPVDENMKKVWAVELDLYKEFKRICEENSLIHFTDGGTTLGAIRHAGFIPWDDDFDVCMPREDYEKLKQLADKFKQPYFLQYPYTDSEYGYSFLRLRNSNTTVIVEPFNYCRFNQGIYIDIFPLDKVTKEKYLYRREKIYERIMYSSSYMRMGYPTKSERDLQLIDTYLKNQKWTLQENYDEIEKIAVMEENEDTAFLSLIVSTQYSPEKKIWPKEIFTKQCKKEFCGIEVDVPIGYDEQLKIYFGNYWEYPPIEQRGTWHKIRFLPEIPYKEYYSKCYWR